MAAHVKDMTQGKPVSLIVNFALPLMLGNVFQQLYTVVDTMVVGKGLGVGALAAVGSAELDDAGHDSGVDAGLCDLDGSAFWCERRRKATADRGFVYSAFDFECIGADAGGSGYGGSGTESDEYTC